MYEGPRDNIGDDASIPPNCRDISFSAVIHIRSIFLTSPVLVVENTATGVTPPDFSNPVDHNLVG